MESDRWPLCFSVHGSVHGSVDGSVHGSVDGSVDQSFRREIGKFGRFIKKFNRTEKNRETKGSYTQREKKPALRRAFFKAKKGTFCFFYKKM